MSDNERGLYGKYIVVNIKSGEEITDCFVLRPGRDPAARAALLAYAEATENAQLADDLQHWLVDIEAEEREG